MSDFARAKLALRGWAILHCKKEESCTTIDPKHVISVGFKSRKAP
jgi:hypothetical protein